jgi:hypothetical protein
MALFPEYDSVETTYNVFAIAFYSFAEADSEQKQGRTLVGAV